MTLEGEITRNERPPASRPPPATRPRILALMVDDNPGDVMIIQHLFRVLRPPFSVIYEHTGHAGVERAKVEQPSFVLVDLNLAPGNGCASPIIDGLEVIRALRECAETQRIPIMVMSGSPRPVDKAAALEAGADAYRVKPMGIREGHELAQDIARWFFALESKP